MYDIIIVGGGPAGLTAALYARRAEKSVLVIEKAGFGGQITYSPKVENIPGFMELSGNEYAEKLVDQVITQGADFESCEVLSIKNDDIKTVVTDEGSYETRAVILACGARHRLLGLDREEEFIGNGISFCAVCDGAFYKNKNVAVIGGGNSALQEAILLSDQVYHLIVVQNLEVLTGEQKLIDQLMARKNVEIVLGYVVDSIKGKENFEGIVIKNVADGSTKELLLDGMFIAIGLVPQNDPFSSIVNVNNQGYVVADESCTTSADGIFVAGDCRTKKIRQVTTAAADGAVAALAACDYLEE